MKLFWRQELVAELAEGAFEAGRCSCGADGRWAYERH